MKTKSVAEIVAWLHANTDNCKSAYVGSVFSPMYGWVSCDVGGGDNRKHLSFSTAENTTGQRDFADALSALYEEALQIKLLAAEKENAVLQQKLDAVLAENVALKAAIPNPKDIDYGNDNMDDVSLAENIGFNDAVTLMNRWKGETPATDAILKEMRAEGAIAVRDALVLAEEGADLYSIATQTADQLRAGNSEGGE